MSSQKKAAGGLESWRLMPVWGPNLSHRDLGFCGILWASKHPHCRPECPCKAEVDGNCGQHFYIFYKTYTECARIQLEPLTNEASSLTQVTNHTRAHEVNRTLSQNRLNRHGIWGMRSMNKPALTHASAGNPLAGQRKR